MPWDPALDKLRDVLADLYPHAKAMRRVAAGASLRLERVALRGDAPKDWQAILEEASRQDALADLIDVVIEEHGRKRALLMAVEYYRQAERYGHKAAAGRQASAPAQAPAPSPAPAKRPPAAPSEPPASARVLQLAAGVSVALAWVPAGTFYMGSPDTDSEAPDCEKPQHQLFLPDYLVGRHPVTVAQLRAFVRATGHPLGRPEAIDGPDDYPATWVSWFEAEAFCHWASRVSGRPVRLPSEPEWEKAARGTDGRVYPWGRRWDPGRCNGLGGGPGHPTPVGEYSPLGDSPYGCSDMVGNVWEWTRSLWGRNAREPDFVYPYDPTDGREDAAAPDDVLRVVRGGAYYSGEMIARCALRDCFSPAENEESNGFRVVV